MIRDDFDEFPRIDADDVERMLAHFRQEPTFLQKRVDLFREKDFFALEEFDRFGQSPNCVAYLGRLQTRFQAENWKFYQFFRISASIWVAWAPSLGVHFGVSRNFGVICAIFELFFGIIFWGIFGVIFGGHFWCHFVSLSDIKR